MNGKTIMLMSGAIGLLLIPQVSQAKLKVFILAGQSNMQGQGVVDMDHPDHYNGGKGNLVYSMENSPDKDLYTHLKDNNGDWVVRDDVWVRNVTANDEVEKGGLTIGFTDYGGSSHIGPELQIGHELGDNLDDQVLLVKTDWGGAALYLQEGNSFHPPSSDGATGNRYTMMLQEVQDALDNLESDFPEYNGEGYEIAGFKQNTSLNPGIYIIKAGPGLSQKQILFYQE